MNKAEFVAEYKKRSEPISKAKAEHDVNIFLETLEDAIVSVDGLSIVGLFSTKSVDVPERSYSTFSGEKTLVPAHKTIKVKFAKKVLERVNQQ